MRQAEALHQHATQALTAEAVAAVNMTYAQAGQTLAQAHAEVSVIRHTAQSAVDQAQLSQHRTVSEMEQVKMVANAVHEENKSQQVHIANLGLDLDNARAVIAEGAAREAHLAATAQ